MVLVLVTSDRDGSGYGWFVECACGIGSVGVVEEDLIT